MLRKTRYLHPDDGTKKNRPPTSAMMQKIKGLHLQTVRNIQNNVV
jgi:hypothetical protein